MAVPDQLIVRLELEPVVMPAGSASLDVTTASVTIDAQTERVDLEATIERVTLDASRADTTDLDALTPETDL